MTAQILKITTPFNSILYWTGSILSANIADAVMVTDENRVNWFDTCERKAMEKACEYFAEQYNDSVVEIIEI
jgi:hypothetical protein